MIVLALLIGGCISIPWPQPTPSPSPTPDPHVPTCNQPPDYLQSECWNLPPGGEWEWIPKPPPPDPDPPPDTNTCSDIADPYAPGWRRDDRPAQMQQKVRAAIAKVAGECGGNCGSDWVETLRRLARELNRAGHCSTGPWVDSLAVLAPDGKVEEYHPVYSGTGSWTDSGHGKYIGAWVFEGGQVASCGPPSPVALPRSIGGPNRHGGPDLVPKFDATGLVKSYEYCTEVGFVRRTWCPVRPECSGPDCAFKDREACEAIVFGVPIWKSDGEIIAAENPWQVKVKRGTWVQCCAGGVCSVKKNY
jgi:hypothetical protein